MEPDCKCGHYLSRHDSDSRCRDCGCVKFELPRPKTMTPQETAREAAWQKVIKTKPPNAESYDSRTYFNLGWQARGEAWVPVSERLPDGYGWYLVTTTKGDSPEVIEARYVHGGFQERCVIAWQPLPEPFNPVPTTE